MESKNTEDKWKDRFQDKFDDFKDAIKTSTSSSTSTSSTAPKYYQDANGNIYDANGYLVKSATSTSDRRDESRDQVGGLPTTTGTTTPAPVNPGYANLTNAYNTQLKGLQDKLATATTAAEKATLNGQIKDI